MIDKANKELVEVAPRSEPFVLRERLFEGLVATDWMSEVRKELAVRCPVVNNILSVFLYMSHHHDKKEPVLCLIYSIIMHLRCHELSRVQWINSILLAHCQASVNVSLKNIINNDENIYISITEFIFICAQVELFYDFLQSDNWLHKQALLSIILYIYNEGKKITLQQAK